jgi:hypothetical protein
MTTKKQYIDPICALCRIAMLNFKSINTKIGVSDYTINVQDPTLAQSLWRRYNGDGKEDIFELFQLITHVIAWFLVPNQKTKVDDHFVTELKKMIKYTCSGLEHLQNTYKTGNVILTLQYYINLLSDGLNGTFEIRRLPTCLVDDIWIDSPLKVKIMNLWDYERLQRVCAMYDNCFKELQINNTEIIDGYLLAIEQLLNTYEHEFRCIVKQLGS